MNTESLRLISSRGATPEPMVAEQLVFLFSSFPLYLRPMRLEVFISDLLYEHDCVVVPGFGGLVANYRPARLNHRTHLIHPPAKHIGFNKNLTTNDGLLVHHIAAITGLSFKEAQLRVEDSVAAFNHSLLHDGRLVWEKIGVFFKDKSGQLQFIPEEQENYLLHAFGLQPVQLNPVETQSAPVETPVIPISEVRRKSGGLWKVAAAIAVPLVIGSALLLRNELKSGGTNFASLNPFREDKIASHFQSRAASSFQIDSLNNSVQYLNAIPESVENTTPLTTTPENAIVKTEAVTTSPKDPDVVIKPPKESKKPVHKRGFAVIGGAFKVRSNADNYLDKLKSQGFDAEIAGTKDGMTLVAYGIYNSRQEAENALSNLRSSDDVRAWIRQQ